MTDSNAEGVAANSRTQAARDAPRVLETAAADVKGVTTTAADRVQQASEDVRRRFSDGADVARDWASDRSDVLRDTVQTKPFMSVGVSAASAFAGGLIVGVLLARR